MTAEEKAKFWSFLSRVVWQGCVQMLPRGGIVEPFNIEAGDLQQGLCQ